MPTFFRPSLIPMFDLCKRLIRQPSSKHVDKEWSARIEPCQPARIILAGGWNSPPVFSYPIVSPRIRRRRTTKGRPVLLFRRHLLLFRDTQHVTINPPTPMIERSNAATPRPAENHQRRQAFTRVHRLCRRITPMEWLTRSTNETEPENMSLHPIDSNE